MNDYIIQTKNLTSYPDTNSGHINLWSFSTLGQDKCLF